ncbi:MAG TPA: hypothetical protein VK155_02895, partial [Bacteroidales bacterium]|nr:hypothetical protein [Bacteroidales bacterium]
GLRWTPGRVTPGRMTPGRMTPGRRFVILFLGRFSTFLYLFGALAPSPRLLFVLIQKVTKKIKAADNFGAHVLTLRCALQLAPASLRQ